MRPEKVAVASRSFSKHPVLRAELLAKFPNATFNDDGASLRGERLARFLDGHELAITALEPVDEALLARLPRLKAIGKFGVGIDMLDLDALERHGVKLGWQGGTNRRSVAELALALILSALRSIPRAAAQVKAGVFKQEAGACLTGRAVGLLGCGHVGRDLVELLAPFRCRLLAFDAKPDAAFNERHGVRMLELEPLLRESDVVSVHLPLVEGTRGVLDARRLALMKKGSVLVNTARGGLVDEAALKRALSRGALGAAAFDVFAEEPPEDAELLALPNFIATPHIGGSTEEAVLAMGRAAIAGLEAPRPAREFKGR